MYSLNSEERYGNDTVQATSSIIRTTSKFMDDNSLKVYVILKYITRHPVKRLDDSLCIDSKLVDLYYKKKSELNHNGYIQLRVSITDG